MNGEEQKETELGNSLLAIIGGAAAMILAGFILYPLEQLVFDQFFEFELFGHKKGVSINDIILFGSLIIYAFAAALAGGFTCSLICRSYEYIHGLILTGIYFALLLISLIGPEERDELLSKFISVIIIGAGILSGTKIGVRKKKRRKDKQNSDLQKLN